MRQIVYNKSVHHSLLSQGDQLSLGLWHACFSWKALEPCHVPVARWLVHQSPSLQIQNYICNPVHIYYYKLPTMYLSSSCFVTCIAIVTEKHFECLKKKLLALLHPHQYMFVQILIQLKGIKWNKINMWHKFCYMSFNHHVLILVWCDIMGATVACSEMLSTGRSSVSSAKTQHEFYFWSNECNHVTQLKSQILM